MPSGKFSYTYMIKLFEVFASIFCHFFVLVIMYVLSFIGLVLKISDGRGPYGNRLYKAHDQCGEDAAWGHRAEAGALTAGEGGREAEDRRTAF